MKFSAFLLGAVCLVAPGLSGQIAPAAAPVTTKWDPWESQHSGVSEALRGIHAVGDGVAWASGAHGTVLRTEDSGIVWQQCTMPDTAKDLDFRSVWAWDANTAIVMSSGPGRESQLYKTTDGCAHWRLLHTNPAPEGFWDGLIFADEKNGYLLGDPVKGAFVLLRTWDGGEHWASLRTRDLGIGNAGAGGAKLGAFAASNSALALVMQAPAAPPGSGTGAAGAGAAGTTAKPLAPAPLPWFGTSGVSGGAGPFVYSGEVECPPAVAAKSAEACLNREWRFEKKVVPIAGGSATAGIFSLGVRQDAAGLHAVAVGGDYAKAGTSEGTAAYLDNASGKWVAAGKPPHGYRSAVAWDEKDGAWIAVGPNGSDVSYDGGKTWQSIGDDGWNAISFPWVVGPEGRIGKLIALKGK